MSKIRVLTYRFDIYNLQTKTVSFPDQEKLLKEIVLSLAVPSMPILKSLK